MELMEKKLIDVLNRTIKAYETIYRNEGNSKLADKAFYDFIAQERMVAEVTGKNVELVQIGDEIIAKLK